MDVSTRFDAQFRPLLSATVGTAAVALAILEFAGSEWDGFGVEGRALIAIAARTAFLAFIVNSVLLVIAYLMVRTMGPVMTFLVNLYGVVVFLVGTFLTGGMLSATLDIASPGAASPPDTVQVFLGLAGVGLILLVAAIALAALFDLARGLFRPKRTAQPEGGSPDVEG